MQTFIFILLFLIKFAGISIALAVLFLAALLVMSGLDSDPSSGGAYVASFIVIGVPASVIGALVLTIVWELWK